jgi:hypothetical protein
VAWRLFVSSLFAGFLQQKTVENAVLGRKIGISGAGRFARF